MSELTITKENLQKAYAEGCSDVKKVLDNLFPGECKREKAWVDVTPDCRFEMEGSERNCIVVYHGGKRVGASAGTKFFDSSGNYVIPFITYDLYEYRFVPGGYLKIEKRVQC